PLLAVLARHIRKLLEVPTAVDPALAAQPPERHRHAIVVGHGRVGKVVCSLLRRHGVDYTAVDHDPGAVTEARQGNQPVYFGDATDPAFLKACGLMEASGVIVSIHGQNQIDAIVREVRKLRPDVLIVSRARDAGHARHLYAIGVTDAVPETIEASLQ